VKQLTAAEALEILDAVDRNHARWTRVEIGHLEYRWHPLLLDNATGLYDQAVDYRWRIAETRYGWFREPTGEGHTVLLSDQAYRDRIDLWNDRVPARMAEGR
jgi:hypothetical protein